MDENAENERARQLLVQGLFREFMGRRGGEVNCNSVRDFLTWCRASVCNSDIEGVVKACGDVRIGVVMGSLV